MKASARRTGTYAHRVRMRDHAIESDEPVDNGGADAGPSPEELLAASLASCTAITMEMYAARKGWELSDVEVSCEVRPARSGSGDPTRFAITLCLPSGLDDEQVARLRTIAGKCPIHRILEGEVAFEQRVELADGPGARGAARA